jgi:hypothetical protein
MLTFPYLPAALAGSVTPGAYPEAYGLIVTCTLLLHPNPTSDHMKNLLL